MSDDRPLDAQAAAPPLIPPRRPIVSLAMGDDDDPLAQLEAQGRQLAAVREQLDAVLTRLRDRPSD
jgi:hypothetical protein